MCSVCFFQIFLLPDRSDKSKRRTTTLASTNDPRWGQTFIYSGFRRTDLNNRVIEVSATLLQSFFIIIERKKEGNEMISVKYISIYFIEI